MDSYCSRVSKTKSLISFVMSSTGILMQRKLRYLPQLSFLNFYIESFTLLRLLAWRQLVCQSHFDRDDPE